MGENSAIEWTHQTFNPWRGCTKVAEGCKFCYADTLSKRNPSTLGVWGDNGTRVMASEKYWGEPVKWNAEAETAGERRRVFCASLADVFEDWEGVMFATGKQPVILNKQWRASARLADRATMNDVRARLFALIDATPWLDWLLLTKRPENVRRMMQQNPCGRIWRVRPEDHGPRNPWYRGNLWLLTSVATQADYVRNLPHLLRCRDLARVLGMSGEPQVGPIDPKLDRIWCRACQDFHDHPTPLLGCMDESKPCFRAEAFVGDLLDWWICGGESGHHARPMHPDWPRSLRDICSAAGVPFFFKQWGEWLVPPFTKDQVSRGRERIELSPGLAVYRVGKKAAGRLLDGKLHDSYPACTAAAVL